MNNKNGLSLIEILVSMAIVSFALLGFCGLYIISWQMIINANDITDATLMASSLMHIVSASDLNDEFFDQLSQIEYNQKPIAILVTEMLQVKNLFKVEITLVMKNDNTKKFVSYFTRK